MSRSISNAAYRFFLRLVKTTGVVGDLVVANVTDEQGLGAIKGRVSVTGPGGENCLNKQFELPALSTESYRTYHDVFGPFGEHTITVDVGEPSASGQISRDSSAASNDGRNRSDVDVAPSTNVAEAGGQGPDGIACVLLHRARGTITVDFDVIPGPTVAAEKFEGR